MELGESAEEAGRREVLEETGIQIGKLELLTVVSGKQTFKVLKNHDEYYSVTIVYVSKEIVGGTLKADGIETTDAKFFGVDKLPETMNPAIASMFQHYSFMKK